MVAELRVDVNSVIRELDIALGMLTEAKIMSRYRRVFRGKGLEFEDFRKYTPQDDASEIDWKSSKRANKLLIRRYKEERDMNVFFIVDVSTSMLFGSTDKLKHEYTAGLVAALAHFVMQSGDKIGLVLFKNDVVKFLGAAKTRQHYFVLLRNLLTPKFYGGGYNISNVMRFVSNVVREKSLAFLVSDFIGMEPRWGRAIRRSTGKLDGIAIKVRDPRDMSVPPAAGQVVISDPYSDSELLIDCADKARLEYEKVVKENDARVREVFTKSGWDMMEVSTAEDFVAPVLRFLKRREMVFR